MSTRLFKCSAETNLLQMIVLFDVTECVLENVMRLRHVRKVSLAVGVAAWCMQTAFGLLNVYSQIMGPILFGIGLSAFAWAGTQSKWAMTFARRAGWKKDRHQMIAGQKRCQALVICLSYLIHAKALPWLDPFRPKSRRFANQDLRTVSSAMNRLNDQKKATPSCVNV